MRQIAIWKYNMYPFYLGGEIVNMREDGCVEIDGYGKGYWFKPVKILPLKAGRNLLEKLYKIENEHRKANETFSSQWKKKLQEIIPYPYKT